MYRKITVNRQFIHIQEIYEKSNDSAAVKNIELKALEKAPAKDDRKPFDYECLFPANGTVCKAKGRIILKEDNGHRKVKNFRPLSTKKTGRNKFLKICSLFLNRLSASLSFYPLISNISSRLAICAINVCLS